MKTASTLCSTAAIAAMLLVTLGATSMPSRTYAYQDSIGTPHNGQQSITARITITPQTNGTIEASVTTNGTTSTTTFSASEPQPAPQGSPSPHRAQGALILQRVALLAQIRRAALTKAPIAVRIPVLPPGALQPIALPTELAASAQGTKLDGSATLATTATIDPRSPAIKGILPVRRAAERLHNAAMPAQVTLPDQVTATVHASIQSGSGKLSGTVSHQLNYNGQSVTLFESWSLTPLK